jgi:hypothetical protein
MKEYICDNCEKKFDRKSNWLAHTQNKKYPCVKKLKTELQTGAINIIEFGANIGANEEKEEKEQKEQYENKKNIICRYCFKQFLYTKNLNKHIREERCEILKLQKQQKENIFINLLEEEKIVNETKKELKTTVENKEINQIEFFMNQINLLNAKLEKQKIESDKKKKNTEEQIKKITDRYNELEKNNKELTKTNEKLQKKMCKIVNKNNINNPSLFI